MKVLIQPAHGISEGSRHKCVANEHAMEREHDGQYTKSVHVEESQYSKKDQDMIELCIALCFMLVFTYSALCRPGVVNMGIPAG